LRGFLPGGRDLPAAPIAARLPVPVAQQSRGPGGYKLRESCHKAPENLPGKAAGNKPEVWTSLECFISRKSTFFNVDKILFNSLLLIQLDFQRKRVMKPCLQTSV